MNEIDLLFENLSEPPAVRTIRALYAAGILTPRDLLRRTAAEVEKMPGVGPAMMADLDKILGHYGWKYRE